MFELVVLQTSLRTFPVGHIAASRLVVNTERPPHSDDVIGQKPWYEVRAVTFIVSPIGRNHALHDVGIRGASHERLTLQHQKQPSREGIVEVVLPSPQFLDEPLRRISFQLLSSTHEVRTDLLT